MSGEMMTFPESPEEFIEQYSFADKDRVYTNGSELIPVFRVRQMLEHYTRKPMERILTRLEEYNKANKICKDNATNNRRYQSERYFENLIFAIEQAISIVKEEGGME